jgi:hypothetical protein
MDSIEQFVQYGCPPLAKAAATALSGPAQAARSSVPAVQSHNMQDARFKVGIWKPRPQVSEIADAGAAQAARSSVPAVQSQDFQGTRCTVGV